MSNRSTILKNYFGNDFITNESSMIANEDLVLLKSNFRNAIKARKNQIVMNNPYGIFAFVENYNEDYCIITFHYVDFRWYPLLSAAKIMHKATIEEWKDGHSYSCKFSESPMRYSGDVLGIMPGDYRDCFKEIVTQEKKRQILIEKSVDLMLDKNCKKVNFQCGIGLERLTMIQKSSQEKFRYVDLIYIS